MDTNGIVIFVEELLGLKSSQIEQSKGELGPMDNGTQSILLGTTTRVGLLVLSNYG